MAYWVNWQMAMANDGPRLMGNGNAGVLATRLPPAPASRPPSKLKLTVPRYVVNGGFSWKFNSDPYGLNLGGMLTAAEYTRVVERLNMELKTARSTRLDMALFYSMPFFVVTAVPFGLRRKRQLKLRKVILNNFIAQFNREHPALLMHYYSASKGGGGGMSELTIEPRSQQPA